MMINSQLFEAYLYCPTKCWLRSRTEPAAANAYAEWARAQNKAYCEGGLNRLLAIVPESERAIAPPITKNLKDANWRFAIDVPVQSHNLESRLHAVESCEIRIRKPRSTKEQGTRRACPVTRNYF